MNPDHDTNDFSYKKAVSFGRETRRLQYHQKLSFLLDINTLSY